MTSDHPKYVLVMLYSLIYLTDFNLRTKFSVNFLKFLIFVCHLYKEIQHHFYDATP